MQVWILAVNFLQFVDTAIAEDGEGFLLDKEDVHIVDVDELRMCFFKAILIAVVSSHMYVQQLVRMCSQ